MKRLVTIILSIIVTICLFIFIGISSSKDMIVNTVKSVYTNEAMTSYIMEGIKNQVPALDDSIMVNVQEKIYRSEAMTSITNKFVDALLYDIEHNTISNIDLSSEINDIADNLIANYNLNDIYSSLIKQELNKINYNKIYINILSNVKKESISNLINIYNRLSSTTVKVILLSIIVISSLIIILLNLNKKIFIILSIPYYINALIYSLLFPILLDSFGPSITNQYLGKTAILSSTSFANNGYQVLSIAVSFTFVYIIIKKVSSLKN